MNLVLLRHASRSAIDAFSSATMPLNTVGLAQAEDLVGVVATGRLLPRPTHLLVSPKLRAKQTLEPLAKHLKLRLDVIDELDERRENEVGHVFQKRVQRAFEILSARFANTDAVVYVCSHLDWLEAAALVWPTDLSERQSQAPWSTLEYQVFELKDDLLVAKIRGRVEPRG